MYESLSDTFLNSGCNLQTLHRLTSIAAGGLDTLPHSPGLFLMFSVLGLNHKNLPPHFRVQRVRPCIGSGGGPQPVSCLEFDFLAPRNI